VPEVACQRTIPVSEQEIWDYVKDMDNWAQFIMGHQAHELLDDKHSVWTVKGELGVLARTVVFEVDITEWIEPSRVRFTITGKTEQFDGEGSFLIGGQPDLAGLPPKRRGWFRRLFARLSRRSRGDERAPAPESGTSFACWLRMDARGMTGPVVNAMIEPLMSRAADDLAEKLRGAILARAGEAESAAS